MRHLLVPVSLAATLGGVVAGIPAGPAANAATNPTTSNVSCTPGADTVHVQCTVTVTTSADTVTIPISGSQGVHVPTGTWQMASGIGQMTLAGGTATFTLDPAKADHQVAPWTLTGTVQVAVDNSGAGPWTLTVDGHQVNLQVPVCGTVCTSPATGATKKAWDVGDGLANSALTSGLDHTIPGRPITFTDTADANQHNCQASVETAVDGLTWTRVSGPVQATNNRVTVQYTPTVAEAVRLHVTCQVDGAHRTYQDWGSVDDTAVQASTPVATAWADGTGTPTPKTWTLPVHIERATVVNDALAANTFSEATLDRRLVAGEVDPAVHADGVTDTSRYVTLSITQAGEPTTAQWITAAGHAANVHLSSSVPGTITQPSSDITYVWVLASGSSAAAPFAGGPQTFLASSPYRVVLPPVGVPR